MARKFKLGRIGRKDFIMGSVGLGMLFGLVTGIAMAFLNDFSDETKEVFLYLLVALMLLSYWLLTIMRLHDLNLSGFVAFCYLVPIINLWISMLLIFKKGTQGPNGYGNDPCASSSTL